MDPIFITNYIRGLVARLAQGGWRPFFGWGGGLVMLWALKFAYVDAPLQGVALPDGYYTGLNTALTIFIGAFIARAVEKVVTQNGGLVNNEALR